jgi:hypothetical protein
MCQEVQLTLGGSWHRRRWRNSSCRTLKQQQQQQQQRTAAHSQSECHAMPYDVCCRSVAYLLLSLDRHSTCERLSAGQLLIAVTLGM